jgi:hypothetical protein
VRLKLTHSRYSIPNLPPLMSGDLFCVHGKGHLSWLIGFFQRLWDKFGFWSHSGIIDDPEGNTVEALWHVQKSSLKTYSGMHIIILRWKGMDIDAYNKGMLAIKPEIGEDYPWYRLFMFIVPKFAHLVATGKFLVCSEIDFKFIIGAGFNKLNDGDGDDDYRGKTPDDVGTLPIAFPEDFIIVYQGVCP